jgi:hypothetical protein
VSEPLPDTWHSRDLPVLRAAVEYIDREGVDAPVHHLIERTGLEEDEVLRAIRALASGGLLTAAAIKTWGPDLIDGVRAVSRQAYELAGAWPTPESATDRMIAALEQIAANGTEEEKTRARKVLDAFTGAGQQIAVGVATAMITGQIS